jgi:sugar phosphate isomerase/epimerase
MKTQHLIFLSLVLPAFLLPACKSDSGLRLDMDKYYAWCIVPFDKKERTPEQRIEMLKELGFKSYAYDWREEHLDEMAHELELARENDIAINAVWIWINQDDTIGTLSTNNERIFKIIEKTGTKTQLWTGFSEDWFEGLTHTESMARAAKMISYLSDRGAEAGCKIGLYNHGGWFGDPVHQAELIKALPDKDLGIIFNFHHAHEHLDNFQELVDIMMPYLWAVNLNGMKMEGPKILPIGGGNLEKDMIAFLEESGYNGPYGILGHVEDCDAKVILRRNIEGLIGIL